MQNPTFSFICLACEKIDCGYSTRRDAMEALDPHYQTCRGHGRPAYTFPEGARDFSQFRPYFNEPQTLEERLLANMAVTLLLKHEGLI